jgi:proline dehydrogenase
VPQPLVYSTFQAYLKRYAKSTLIRSDLISLRTYPYLKKAIADAKTNGYTLGVKLVRGAYHPIEIRPNNQQLAVSTDATQLPPVFEHKEETDRCYNQCANLLIESVAAGMKQRKPVVGVLFGTHNWTSAKLVLQSLAENGLATVAQVKASDGDLRIKVPDEVVAQVSIGQLYGENAH